MGQSGVLRIHAETNLETTRKIYTVGQLERVIVAFMPDNVHRNGCAEMLASIAVGNDDHIDADSIVQALLVYDVADRKWCAADQLSVEHARRIVVLTTRTSSQRATTSSFHAAKSLAVSLSFFVSCLKCLASGL